MSPRRFAPVVLALTAAMFFSGMPAVHASASAQSAGAVVEIEVGDNFFAPRTVKIAPGTTVRWTNVGRSRHNVLPDTGKQFGKKGLKAGSSYEFTFEDEGSFRYFCSIHGAPGIGQFGTIKVTNDGDGVADATVASHSAASGNGTTIRVPQDENTIQKAVDASTPGSLILVAPGVYHEAVVVPPKRRNIVIRGVDRDATIVDGRFSEKPGKENGFKVFADGVAIENITAQNFVTNGFYWIGVDGYRGSYLNAIRNGDYGIYAFDSVHGQFDHSYASGSPDAGYYIGQCYPCDALVIDSEAEWNGLGYSGTNAGGNLVIARTSMHDNRVGIVPNSGTGEKLAPQHGATVVGNHVYDNNNIATAGIEIAEIALGNGILVAGGNDNIVERNLVTGHPNIGIGVIPLPESLTAPDNKLGKDFDARNNSVRDNVSSGNQFDLASVATISDAADTGENCFAGNTAATTLPANLEGILPCGAPAQAYEAPIAFLASLFLGDKPPVANYRKVALPHPPKGANMPKARTARARPATNEPSIKINVADLAVPTP